MEEQIKMAMTILKDPELQDSIADMSWGLFQKLKEKGFTEEQAMEIVGRWALK